MANARPSSSSARSAIASAMGIMMRVVAVLEIHIERTAAAIEKPRTSRRGDVPTISRT